MAQIKVPATPRGAYNPKRPANTLLLTHVRELETALSKAGRRVRRKKPQTEEQVAAYIRHLNRALHHQMLLPPMKRRPLDVPLDERSPTSQSKPRRGSRKRTATSAARRKKASSSRKRKQGQRS